MAPPTRADRNFPGRTIWTWRETTEDFEVWDGKITNRGVIDSGNSTTALLGTNVGVDDVFTGDAVNIVDYGIIFLTIFSDADSAVNGLSVQQSSDGVNWDNTDDISYFANTGKTYSFQPGAMFFRVVYTNGAVAQTEFRLQVLFKTSNAKI